MIRNPTLLGKLTVQIGLGFMLTTLAVGSAVFLFSKARLEAEVDASLRRDEAGLFAPVNGHAPDAAALAGRVAEWERHHGVRDKGHLVLDARGRILAGRIRLSSPAAEGLSDVVFAEPHTKRREGRALVAPVAGGGTFIAVAHSEIAEDMSGIMPLVAVAVALGALGVGLMTSLLSARLIAARLMVISRAADAITAGDLSRRVPAERLDGLFAQQAESFNRMLDRMEEILLAQRHFAGNLAHDLRTPLTRLRGLLAEPAGDRDQERQRLERAERECASTLATFDALLRLSELEAGRHHAEPETVDLYPLLEDVVETMEPVMEDSSRSIRFVALDDVAVDGDPALLAQMLINLIENVVKHTPTGTHALIRLSGDRMTGEALLEVTDNGPGIARHQRLRVVRPFERGQNVGSKGSGLGLAIVQAIVRFHRGSIELLDAHPGLLVRLRFPARTMVGRAGNGAGGVHAGNASAAAVAPGASAPTCRSAP